MDELVQQIASATGISQEQAREALQMVVDFLDAKLPPQVAEQIDAVLSSNAPGDE
jgi:nucleoid DNA-binding protein